MERAGKDLAREIGELTSGYEELDSKAAVEEWLVRILLVGQKQGYRKSVRCFSKVTTSRKGDEVDRRGDVTKGMGRKNLVKEDAGELI